MKWCHYVAALPPANRCSADRGFEYRYICRFEGTRERAVILDNLIQIFLSNTQIRSKNQISQRSVIRIRRSGIFQIISDVLSDVWRTDPCLTVCYSTSTSQSVFRLTHTHTHTCDWMLFSHHCADFGLAFWRSDETFVVGRFKRLWMAFSGDRLRSAVICRWNSSFNISQNSDELNSQCISQSFIIKTINNVLIE